MDAEVAATVRRAVAELFEDAPDLDKVFSAITERAAKYVSDAGHETIRRNAVRDPRARGWKRVAHGETCDFCLMLTGRGGVYTRSSVRFKSHVKCNCGVAPSWDASEPEVPEIAYQASARTSGMTREERQIHNERIQAWIDENRDALDELRASLATA